MGDRRSATERRQRREQQWDDGDEDKRGEGAEHQGQRQPNGKPSDGSFEVATPTLAGIRGESFEDGGEGESVDLGGDELVGDDRGEGFVRGVDESGQRAERVAE
ncbi:MAG: hypothetical protein RJB65_1949, partial [Actinomycetota bacterium]